MLRVDILTKNEEAEYERFLNKCEYVSCQSSLEWRNTIQPMREDEPYLVIAKENDEIVGALPL
jgi:hypothetical protein